MLFKLAFLSMSALITSFPKHVLYFPKCISHSNRAASRVALPLLKLSLAISKLITVVYGQRMVPLPYMGSSQR